MRWIAAIRNGPDVSVSDVCSPWLTDEFVESYGCWREESATVKEAYEHWTGEEDGDGSLAFAAYRAALDREERAARAYQQCAERGRRTDAVSLARALVE